MSPKIPPPPPSGKDKTITFHRFPHHIWHDQNLSLHERVVLCRVWSFENSTPPLPCYLSFEQWAKELGCKRRHTIKLLNSLIEKKLLSKTGRGTQTNLWALVHTEHQQEDASVHRTLPSAYRTLALVHTEHQTSVLSAPKKIKEDHKEDHKKDQAVADAPPIPLSPTVTSSGIEPIDLVTHGDDPSHLRGLPWTYSPTLHIESLEKSSQESDSLKELTEVSEAPPLPAPPPRAKKEKKADSGWADVQAAATPEQWESIEMWRKHRTQMKKPCTPLSVMQNIKKYGSDLSAAIEHSIEKGWQGIFPPSRNGTDTKEPLTAGLTDKEIDLRLDFIWAHYKNSPIIPVRPFKDLAEENFVIDVVRSIFGDDYEEAIKKRRTDEKQFYEGKFRAKYKQGVEQTKV